MLNDYKKKFILSNMVFVGIVLFFMLTAIFIYSHFKNISNLAMAMAQLTDPFHMMQNAPKPLIETPDTAETWIDPPKTPSKADPAEIHRKSRSVISVFFYNDDSKEISFLSEHQILEKDSLEPVIEKIVSSSKCFGKLPDEKLYFYKIQEAHTFKISITDTGAILNPAAEMLLIMLLIFLSTMFFFYLISKHLANVAVRPLEASLMLEKQFIADTSHDLKTPLTIILANTSILRHNPKAFVSDMMQWIERTETAAHNMQTLIEGMLMLSDMESAEHKIKMKPINISDMAEMIALLIEPIAYEKGISFQTDITENIYVCANEGYLKRVFLSLIENAIKYEPTGGAIHISLSRQQNRVQFTVNNKLTIIDSEDLPYIFERFYRSDKSRQDSCGHGLGLAIAKRMTTIMNGKIDAESSTDKGTTFQVTFKINKQNCK